MFLTLKKPFKGACPGTLGYCIKENLRKQELILITLQLTLARVAVLHKLEPEEFPLLTHSRWLIDLLEVPLRGSTTGVKALRTVLQSEHSSRYVVYFKCTTS